MGPRLVSESNKEVSRENCLYNQSFVCCHLVAKTTTEMCDPNLTLPSRATSPFSPVQPLTYAQQNLEGGHPVVLILKIKR
ncbi:hypothetical protein OUZ56_025294 [Daphnia magna]|uniref:Uncharacterized protein n=1 Tax=Daphnia magna TaxID=35525 RepID=A0ABQ9ZJE7_9CRUS|nr:hypothetical protein OUZ56_025294 [Daphnia magna]